MALKPHNYSLYSFVRKWLTLGESLPFQLKASGESGYLQDDTSLERYTPSAVFQMVIDPGLLQDVREQTGKLHLVKKDILNRLEEL